MFITGNKSNQIKCIYIALRTSADISKCSTETQPKTPNSKQCRCRSTVVRKNGQIIIITGRTVETGAAARPGELGTASSQHTR